MNRIRKKKTKKKNGTQWRKYRQMDACNATHIENRKTTRHINQSFYFDWLELDKHTYMPACLLAKKRMDDVYQQVTIKILTFDYYHIFSIYFFVKNTSDQNDRDVRHHYVCFNKIKWLFSKSNLTLHWKKKITCKNQSRKEKVNRHAIYPRLHIVIWTRWKC